VLSGTLLLGFFILAIPSTYLVGAWEYLALHAILPSPPVDKINTIQSVLLSTSYKELLALSPVILSIEIIVIYFFRILLKNFQSISAQIVQLELRKALCSFIEKYTEHKAGLGEYVDLTGFEKLVFSEISVNPGQVPHTFEGIEQIAKIANKSN
jgi:hypothetical protein